jgi:hypothetical protein
MMSPLKSIGQSFLFLRAQRESDSHPLPSTSSIYNRWVPQIETEGY